MDSTNEFVLLEFYLKTCCFVVEVWLPKLMNSVFWMIHFKILNKACEVGSVYDRFVNDPNVNSIL